MTVVLMIVYVALIVVNLIFYINNKLTYPFIIITIILLILLMSGHQYQGNGDAIDFLAYWRGYTYYYELPQPNYWYYYLFNISQEIGHLFYLSFYQWWSLMTGLSLLFIIYTIRKRKMNPHMFLVYFMLYYVFLFYGGLKFYYGFCIFQYAFNFLLSSSKKSKYKYVFFTILAGGFHVMYYILLVFVFVFY